MKLLVKWHKNDLTLDFNMGWVIGHKQDRWSIHRRPARDHRAARAWLVLPGTDPQLCDIRSSAVISMGMVEGKFIGKSPENHRKSQAEQEDADRSEQ